MERYQIIIFVITTLVICITLIILVYYYKKFCTCYEFDVNGFLKLKGKKLIINDDLIVINNSIIKKNMKTVNDLQILNRLNIGKNIFIKNKSIFGI
jgi:hypothetical protein